VLDAHERLAANVDRAVLDELVALVPVDWFADADPPDVYVEYLSRRIERADFAAEAERARGA
jgi:hypothetical protein